jgi:hypothetical protein
VSRSSAAVVRESMRNSFFFLVIGLLLSGALVGCLGGATVLDVPDASTPDAAGHDGSASDAGARDGSARDDAGGPGPDGGRPDRGDAGPLTGAHYTLETAPAFGIEHVGCEAIEDVWTDLRVIVPTTSSCDTGGPVDAEVDADARTVRVRARRWRIHGPECLEVEGSFQRDVRVMLDAGAWRVTGGGNDLELIVGPFRTECTALRPGLLGERCEIGCGCSDGSSCLPNVGDAACEHTCQLPCEGVMERAPSCRAERECGPSDYGLICETRSDDACNATDRPCGAGLSCRSDTPGDLASYCDWDASLSSSTRHACSVNGDCDAGLDCVEHPGGERRCEVRCETTDMHCPGAHICSRGSVEEDRGVCAWVGD